MLGAGTENVCICPTIIHYCSYTRALSSVTALEPPLERPPSIFLILPGTSLGLGKAVMLLRQDVIPSFPQTIRRYMICAVVTPEPGVTDVRPRVMSDASNKSLKKREIWWHGGI